MSNKHIQEIQYHEYLDNDLSENEYIKFEAHIADCQKCRRELDKLRLLFTAIESVPETSLQIDLSAEIMDGIRPITMLTKQWKFALTFQMILVFGLIAIAWPVIDTWYSSFQTPSLTLDIDPMLSEISNQLYLYASNISLSLESWLGNMSFVQVQTDQISILITTLMISASILWLLGNGILLRGSFEMKR